MYFCYTFVCIFCNLRNKVIYTVIMKTVSKRKIFKFLNVKFKHSFIFLLNCQLCQPHTARTILCICAFNNLSIWISVFLLRLTVIFSPVNKDVKSDVKVCVEASILDFMRTWESLIIHSTSDIQPEWIYFLFKPKQ